jgi:hypothetical protein
VGNVARIEQAGGVHRLTVEAVPQLRRLVASFPSPHPGFEPRSIYMVFMVGKVVLGQVSSESFSLSSQYSFH